MIPLPYLQKHGLQWASFEEVCAFLDEQRQSGIYNQPMDDSRADMVDLVRVFSYEEDLASEHPLEAVSVRELIPSQKNVSSLGLLELAQGKRGIINYPIFVVVVDDKLYIRDGHHRAWLFDALGIQFIDAHIVHGGR